MGGVMDPSGAAQTLKGLLSKIPGVWIAVPCTKSPPGSSSILNAESGLFPMTPETPFDDINSTKPQRLQLSRIGSPVASPERRWSGGMAGSQAEPRRSSWTTGVPRPRCSGLLRLPAALRLSGGRVEQRGPRRAAFNVDRVTDASRARRDSVLEKSTSPAVITKLLRPLTRTPSSTRGLDLVLDQQSLVFRATPDPPWIGHAWRVRLTPNIARNLASGAGDHGVLWLGRSRKGMVCGGLMGCMA